ncbi:MAG TPA: GspE/PulE family protein, partial [Actinomycetota bacterium]|nr:GspE/PulE family protein [Actinomycetota bacterium]
MISAPQLQEALVQQAASGKRVGALLEELGLIDERTLTATLSLQLGIPIADLRHIKPEPSALERMPEAKARALGVLPIRQTPGGLEVVVADPRPEISDELVAIVGGSVSLLLAPMPELVRAIDRSYRAAVDVDAEIQSFLATETSRQAETPTARLVSEDAPVVRVVNLVITQALRDRASDVHIEPKEDRVRVRFRIDGALHDIVSLPAGMAAAMVSRLKIMAEMNIVERQRSQDGQISMEIDGRQVDIRVATTPTIFGEKAVLRLLDKSRQLLRLEELGMPEDVRTIYRNLIRSPFGMVICAGPTGSGKTTTLYGTLSEVNNSERNIMTVEDPVEYVFPSINQIQIREQAGVTFAGGLKAILRQDPDVILVGEIRDVETARIAVQSALTGHLVLSSLHATDAAGALQRFLDMGLESFLIASSVIAVLSQRLVRRICESCREPYEPGPEELAFYSAGGGPAKTEFWHGAGCNLCAHTGYQDRIGVFELLPVTDHIKELIVQDASHDAIRTQALRDGMRSLGAHALTLVESDVT